MKWRWLFLTGFVVLGGCGSAVVVLSSGTAEESFIDSSNALDRAMERHHARFVADQKLLSSLPVFDPKRTKAGPHDAGDLLRDKIPFPSTAHEYPPVFDEALSDKLGSTSVRKFPGELLGLDVSSVNTGWMAELADKDHWDLFLAPRVAELRPVSLYMMPLPSMVDGLRWSKVRLLQGLRGTGPDFVAAARDVENLARLLFSTDVLAGQSMAIACLRHVEKAARHARDRGLDLGSYAPLDEATLDAASRAYQAYRAYADIHATSRLADAVFTSSEAVVGRCAALEESAALLVMTRTLTGGLFDAPRERIGRLLAANRDVCRFSALGDAWDNPAQTKLVEGVDALCNVETASPVECVVMSVVGSIPGMRDLQVEAFVAGEASQLMDGYAKSAPPPPAP